MSFAAWGFCELPKQKQNVVMWIKNIIKSILAFLSQLFVLPKAINDLLAVSGFPWQKYTTVDRLCELYIHILNTILFLSSLYVD